MNGDRDVDGVDGTWGFLFDANTPYERVETIIHEYPEKMVHLEFFRCEWLRHEPVPLACDEVRWVTVRELKQFAFPAADERLLERLGAERALWRDRGGEASSI